MGAAGRPRAAIRGDAPHRDDARHGGGAEAQLRADFRPRLQAPLRLVIADFLAQLEGPGILSMDILFDADADELDPFQRPVDQLGPEGDAEDFAAPLPAVSRGHEELPRQRRVRTSNARHELAAVAHALQQFLEVGIVDGAVVWWRTAFGGIEIPDGSAHA